MLHQRAVTALARRALNLRECVDADADASVKWG
jgi:hypothetical protein